MFFQLLPGRRHRPIPRAVGTLTALLAVAACAVSAAAQTGGYTPIEPIQSRSSTSGLIDQAANVTYDEYSGNLTVDLSVGVRGLSVPVHLSSVRSTVASYYPMPSSSLLSVGYGALGALTPEPLEISEMPQNAPPTNYQKVLLREVGGIETEFVPDLFFQQVPSGDGWYNYHHIDTRLRRLERTIDPAQPSAHTLGVYTLLGRDGSRTIYRPRSAAGPGTFYPTEMEAPNGRMTLLTYRDSGGVFPDRGKGEPGDPVLAGSPEPLLESIEDEWGRRLRLHYELRSTGVRVVQRISLEAPGQSSQDLATFVYAELPLVNGEQTVISKRITAEGHAHELTYAPGPSGLPNSWVLDRVVLPTGGAVELDWKSVDQPFCPYQYFGNTSQTVELSGVRLLRLESLSYAGQTYAYSYQTGEDVSELHDGSWVVHRTSFAVPGENHERLTQYHHERTYAVGSPPSLSNECQPLAFPKLKAQLAGRPIRRLTSHGGPVGSIVHTSSGNFTFQPGGTHRRQEWAHITVPLRRNGNPVDLRADIVPKVAVELEYSEKRDGRVWTTHTDRGPSDNAFTAPAYDLPTRVTTYRADQSAQRSVQTFEHESRVVDGHNHTTTIADQPHVIGLVTHTENGLEEVGNLHVVARQEYGYASGRHPLLIYRSNFTGPESKQEETWSHFSSGPWHGLVQHHDRGATGTGFIRQVRTEIEAYAFGEASRIQPPQGPPILRQVRADGPFASVTENGVRRDYDYDGDQRLIRVRWPGSSQVDEVTEWSAPGQPPARSRRMGDRLIEEASFDPWGRPATTQVFIDPSTTAETATTYDSLGRISSESNASGARRHYTYDMLGRVRTERVHQGSLSGALLESIDHRYTAPTGGLERTTTTFFRVDGSGSTIQEQDVDFFGRRVRSATTKDGETHQTLQSRRFVDGFERTLVQPEGGTDWAAEHAPRLAVRDWLDRVTLECHPEFLCSVDVATFEPVDGSRAVAYTFDDLGRMIASEGPGSERSVFGYDALDRLVFRSDAVGDGSAGTTLVETARFTYDPATNQQIRAESQAAGPSNVVTDQNRDFDELNRPTKLTVHIPEAAPAPYELAPSKYWLYGNRMTFSWTEAVFVDRYRLEFQRLGSVSPGVMTPALAFEVIPDGQGEVEFELREAQVRAAVAALGDLPGASLYLSDLDADPDFLLNPSDDLGYRWRVYGWRDDDLYGSEPTLASAWTVLDHAIGPDDCHFEHFRVRDGVSEGASVEWRTVNCPEQGPFEVRMSATVEHPTEGCSLEDALFTTAKNGPKRAYFMVTGWDMEDGAPKLPTDPNAPQCAPVEEASFRGAITDSEGVEIHTVGPSIGRVIEGGVCDVRNVNVIDGLGGTAPAVRWQTQDCEDHLVELVATAITDESNADVCSDVGVLGEGVSGQVLASFMLEGYQGSDGVSCPPVERALFHVRTTSPEGWIFESTPVSAFVEPDGGLIEGCYTRLFTEATAPGLVPIIGWETRGCEGYGVELTRSTVGLPQDLRCILRDELWQTAGYGARDASFMVYGYPGADGVFCDPVADMVDAGRDRVEFDFAINLRDPQTGAWVEPQALIKKTLRATYTLPPAGSPDGPCRIDYFGVQNGLHGRLPQAAWGTSGECSEVRLRVYTDDTVQPASCRLNGQIWSYEPDGPNALMFMVGGYDVGLTDNYDGVMDCRGEPGGNGTYGQALRQAGLVLEAIGSDGTMVRLPETSTEPVINHNDQIHPDQPGPSDPCEILDFGMYQPPIPGLQPTDSLPIVSWSTNCAAESRYSVQLLVSTHSIDHDPYCRLDNRLMSSSNNGPLPLRFLHTGWWDEVIGERICLGREATVNLHLVDTQTGEIVPGQIRGPQHVTYSGPISGQPPVPACAHGCTGTGTGCSNPIPTFPGLDSAPQAGADCRATLGWQPATSHCGGSFTYDIYRGAHPGVEADEAFRIATGVVGTSFEDDTIVPGGSYYYVATAIDSASGVESPAAPARRLEGSCAAAGGSPFRVEPSTITPGQSATLSWDFPAAEEILIVGIGDLPPTGQLTVSPQHSTAYQAYVSYFDTTSSYRVDLTVSGSQGDPPVPGGPCNRSCSDSVVIDGQEYYCRGFGAWDGDYEIDQPPVWLAVEQWGDYVHDGLGRPISPYCLKAVCGGGEVPPNPWHEPHNEPYIWNSDESLALYGLELAGDGWDNDCDLEIDEYGE